MNLKYVSVEDAAKRAGKDEFLRNVRSAVIPRLIQKGMLHGKKEKKRQLVADDDALAQLVGLGVETFVQNQQGYSFMVVRAPIEDVAKKLKARPSVTEYEESVKALRMKDDVGIQPDEKVRQTFLLQMRGTPVWSILVQTVHWFHSCDPIMVTALACALSKDPTAKPRRLFGFPHTFRAVTDAPSHLSTLSRSMIATIGRRPARGEAGPPVVICKTSCIKEDTRATRGG